MKLQAIIIEVAFSKKEIEKPFIITEFIDDKEKQHFELFIEDFDAYYLGIRKWEIWELSIKWKSKIFTDRKTEVKSYFTHLICTKALPVFQLINDKLS